jgi:rhamnogalacturonyl hydrolase YesR
MEINCLGTFNSLRQSSSHKVKTCIIKVNRRTKRFHSYLDARSPKRAHTSSGCLVVFAISVGARTKLAEAKNATAMRQRVKER